MFLIGQAEGTWEEKVPVYTDFRTISGLRRGSPVQLAGVEIGTVDAINFVERAGDDLVCDPLTEDIGRFDGDRTDGCSSFLFCSPDKVCAELEPYAAKGLHAPCMTTQDCTQEEICVTKEFRHRYRRVFWPAPSTTRPTALSSRPGRTSSSASMRGRARSSSCPPIHPTRGAGWLPTIGGSFPTRC